MAIIMASVIHNVEQHKSTVRGIEAMTLVSSHHFPRHSHDQFGVGVIAFGAQRSWSGVGQVSASAGDVIMANPGEMHDGAPLGGHARGWRMIYLDPHLVAREVEEEIVGPVELVRPVARDEILARRFAQLFACLTASRTECLATEENLLCCLIHIIQKHGMIVPKDGTARASCNSRSPCVAKAIQCLDSAPDTPVSLAALAALSGVSRFQLLRSFAREIGITPHAYLVQRRVRVARQLLSHGITPAQAALQAGFADQSHMTRAFVRQIGITPARYRAAVS
jgi:AraC-like DNA-binding protein